MHNANTWKLLFRIIKGIKISLASAGDLLHVLRVLLSTQKIIILETTDYKHVPFCRHYVYTYLL